MKRLLVIMLLTVLWVSCSSSAMPSGTTITTTSSNNCAANGNCPEVTIFWKDTTTGPLTHTVLRSATSGGPYTVLASNLTGSSYMDKNVKKNDVWYYVATSTNSYGTSKYSNEFKGLP